MKRNRGMSLVAVLVISALLSLVAVGFLSFIRAANRAQSNTAKISEAASIEMNMRALVGNNQACLASLQGINLGATGPQDGTMRNADGVPVLTKNQSVNGLSVVGLDVIVRPVSRNVHPIQFVLTLRKEGDAGGKQTYRFVFRANVTVNGGVAQRCYRGDENNGSLAVIGQQDFYTAYGPGGNLCGAILGDCGVMSGITPSQYNIIGPGPQAACSGDYTGASCTNMDGPGLTFVAKGNFVGIDYRADIGVGVGPVAACAPMTGIGVSTIDALVYEGGSLLHQTNVSHIQINGDNANLINRIIGSSANKFMLPVQAFHTYRIVPRLYAMSSGVEKFSSLGCGVGGTIVHYLQNNL